MSISQWLSNASFWPQHSNSTWSEYAPLCYWLVEQVRPPIIVEIGPPELGSASSFCYALDRLNLRSSLCYSIRDAEVESSSGFPIQAEKDEPRKQRVNRQDILSVGYEKPEIIRGKTIDILSIADVDLIAAHVDLRLWLETVSEDAVVLVQGIGPEIASRRTRSIWRDLSHGRASLEFYHGRGAGLVLERKSQSSVAAAIEAIRDPAEANEVRLAYQRLGAIWSDEGAGFVEALNVEVAQLRERVRDLKGSLTEKNRQVIERVSMHESMFNNMLQQRNAQIEIQKEIVNRLGQEKKVLEQRIKTLRTRNARQARRLKTYDANGGSVTISFPRFGRSKLVEGEREEVRLPPQEAPNASNSGAQQTPEIQSPGPESLIRKCRELLKQNDPAAAVHVLEEAEDRLSRTEWSRTAHALKGICMLRLGNFANARQVWKEYWDKGMSDPFFRRLPGRHSTIVRQREPNRHQFETLSITAQADQPAAGRFCVYTALFGDYDVLRSPLYKPDNVDFICFSDKPRVAPGWDVRIVEPEFDDPAKCNRKLKILPHRHLPDFDHSIYIDANVILTGNMNWLRSNWLADETFAAWRHPDRDDVYLECEAVLAGFRRPPDGIIDQYEAFKAAHLPANSGLIEACFLWRSHEDTSVRALMDDWWGHVDHHGARDQPGLGFLMWKTGTRPRVFPLSQGNSRSNSYTQKLPHLETQAPRAKTGVVG